MQFEEVEDLESEVTEVIQEVADDPANNPFEFLAVDSLGRRVDIAFVAGCLQLPTGNCCQRLNALNLNPSEIEELVEASQVSKSRSEILRIVREAANRKAANGG